MRPLNCCAPPEVSAACKAAGVALDQDAPIAEPGELADYDAIIFGTPTRFGNFGRPCRLCRAHPDRLACFHLCPVFAAMFDLWTATTPNSIEYLTLGLAGGPGP